MLLMELSWRSLSCFCAAALIWMGRPPMLWLAGFLPYLLKRTIFQIGLQVAPGFSSLMS